jgi:predicted DNA-binding transcriptional regulator YafY
MRSKFAKLNQLIQILTETSSGKNLESLAREMDVHPKTIRRYLQEIQKSGYALEDCNAKKGSRGERCYRIVSGEDCIHLEGLVQGLHSMQTELQSWGNPKFQTLLEEIQQFLLEKSGLTSGVTVEKERHVLNGDIQSPYYVNHGPFAQQQVSHHKLKILEKAIVEHRILQLEYMNSSGDIHLMDVSPYKLALRVGTLYLVGDVQEEFRSLSVSRIQRCLSTSQTYVPKVFSIQEHYRYCFGAFFRKPGEKPQKVVLEVHEPWAEQYLSHSHFDPPGKWLDTSSRQSHRRFSFEVVIKTDLINWLVSHWGSIYAVEPRSLQQKVLDRVQKGLDRWEVISREENKVP